MRMSVEQLDHASVVRPAGEIDISSAPQLRAELLMLLADAPRLVVDLSEVTLLDSSGLAALVFANRQATKAGKPFGLASPGATAARVLRVMGLDKHIAVYASRDEALNQMEAL